MPLYEQQAGRLIPDLLSFCMTLLAMAIIGGLVPSGIWPMETLSNLTVHAAVPLLAGAIGLFLVGRKMSAGAFACIATMGIVIPLWGLTPYVGTQSNTSGTGSLRVLSFNALHPNTENGSAIADMIIQSDVDVAIVLEAFPIVDFMDELKAEYPYWMGCDDPRTCDLVLMSRHPFAASLTRSPSRISRQRMHMIELDLPEGPVNLIAAHLTKPYYDDYARRELAYLARIIAEQENPVVVAGDFNATSWSRNMTRFLRVTGLKTAGFEPGTWPSAIGFLGLSIDHIFVEQPLSFNGLHALPEYFGSNHRGLVAEIKFPQSS